MKSALCTLASSRPMSSCARQKLSCAWGLYRRSTLSRFDPSRMFTTIRTTDGVPTRRTKGQQELHVDPPSVASSMKAADEGTFKSWCNAKDIKVNNLDIHVTKLMKVGRRVKATTTEMKGGRGLIAIRDVKVNDVLIDLPRRSSINVVNDMATPSQEFVPSSAWKQLPPRAKLACLLLYEKGLGKYSAFEPYLRMLPDTFTRAARLGPNSLRALQYPWLLEEVAKERALVEEWQEELRRSGALCPRGAHFQWAVDVVHTRMVSAPMKPMLKVVLCCVRALFILSGMYWALDYRWSAKFFGVGLVIIGTLLTDLVWGAGMSRCYALFPMADLLNHRTRAAPPLQYQYFADRFELRADGPCRAGQECLVSYGPLSNDELLLRYGFVEAGNPQDVYVFPNLAASLPNDLRTSDADVLPFQATVRPDGKLDDLAHAAVVGGWGSNAPRALRQALGAELARRVALPPADGPDADLVSAFRAEKERVLRQAVEALTG